jgi:SAM-dependent methyltransferase
MKTNRNLDQETSEYNEKAKTHFENELILNWYPKRILKRIASGLDILELGIGHGYTPLWFAEKAKNHVVVDGSSVVIEQFLRTNPGYPGKVVHSFFEEYDSSDAFDYIIMGFILEHVDNPLVVLERFKKYLKPTGSLFVIVPNGKSLNRRIGYAMGMIDDLYSLNQNDLALGHKRQYCLDTLRQDIEQSGYRICHQEGVYLKPLPLHILQGINDADQNFQALMEVGIDFPDLTVAILVEAKLA